MIKICTGRSTTDQTSSYGRSASRFRFGKWELMLEEREHLFFHLRMNWQAMLLRAWWVTRVEHLSRVYEYLPRLADSAEAPENLERASKPLSPRELCGLIMRAIPHEWADQ